MRRVVNARRVWVSWVVVMAALFGVVGADLVRAAPASAQGGSWADDPDHWAYETAEWVRDQCVSVPESLMGVATAVVAPMGLMKSAGSPSSAPEAQRRTLTAQELGAMMERDKIVDDLKWMRAQQAAGAPNPGNYTWSQLISEAEGKLERLNRSPFSRMPVGTVGAAGGSTVNTGSNPVKTSSSGSTGLRIVGTSVAAIGGSATAKVALVGAGALCGSIWALSAIFGDPWAEAYEGPLLAMDSEPMRPCTEYEAVPGAQPGDWCVQVEVPEVPPVNRITAGSGQVTTEGGELTYGNRYLPLRRPDGSLLTGNGNPWLSGTWYPISSGTHVVPFACADPDNLCGVAPMGYVGTGAAQALNSPVPVVDQGDGLARWGSLIWVAQNSGMAAVAYFDAERQSRGAQRRLAAESSCKRPGDGHETSELNYSATFWDDEEPPEWPSAGCPVGYAPTSFRLFRQTRSGGSWSPSVWAHPQDSLNWELPSNVQNNPTTLACFVVGATDCPMVEDPTNPAQQRVGGPSGLAVPVGAPMSSEALDEVLRAVDVPAEAPEDLPTFDEIVEPVPQNPGDGTSPEQSCPGAPGCPSASTPEGPPPPELEGDDGCWPSGWGWFNPLEWVLHPIKCALVWAFWDQDAADEIAALGDEHGWVDLVTESSLTTDSAAGPCIDMDAAEICTSEVLGVEAPPWVSALLAAVVLFFVIFEAVGLFARVTGGGS